MIEESYDIMGQSSSLHVTTLESLTATGIVVHSQAKFVGHMHCGSGDVFNLSRGLVRSWS